MLVGICIVILYFFRIIFYIYWDYIFIFFCLTAFPVGRSKRIPDFDDMLIDFSSLCQPPNNQRLLNIFIFKCWSLFFRLLTFFTHITAEPLSVVNLFNSLFFNRKFYTRFSFILIIPSLSQPPGNHWKVDPFQLWNGQGK